MGIKGFQGTSLLDFPGRVASLIFYGGCNLTCPYCHNPSLVLEPNLLEDYSIPSLLDELKRRAAFIDGVVISGGEPTFDKGLLPLLQEIKELGLQVKLDTNGLAPQVLEEAMLRGLVDMVALDLKTGPSRYCELHSARVDVAQLVKSVRLLLEGEVDYEIRTTCVPGLVDDAEVKEIGALIRGANRWMLQQFVPGNSLAESSRSLTPYDSDKLRSLGRLARDYVLDVTLRGI